MLQNRVMRIIAKKRMSDGCHRKDLQKETGFLSVNQMIAQHTLNETYKILKYNTVPHIVDCFTKIATGYQTRSSQSSDVRKVISNHSKRSDFLENAPRLWNQTKEEIRAAKTVHCFSRQAKKWIRENIPF